MPKGFDSLAIGAGSAICRGFVDQILFCCFGVCRSCRRSGTEPVEDKRLIFNSYIAVQINYQKQQFVSKNVIWYIYTAVYHSFCATDCLTKVVFQGSLHLPPRDCRGRARAPPIRQLARWNSLKKGPTRKASDAARALLTLSPRRRC